MAGAGYKLFATGDVLTAAQVNTYLMEQTVMRFADSAARTTALSGVLAEGMVSYLQDTNTLEVYDGAAWVGATGDITGLTAGTGISISSATGPVPTVTNSMATEITAKGDLIVGTGSATFDNLAAGSNGETLVADSSTSTGLRYQSNFAAGKNKIINGDMVIAQRGTSVAGITTDNTYNTVDRFLMRCVTIGTYTQSQETDAPAGFSKSLKVLCTTADASPAASDRLAIVQKLEGDSVQDLAYGTASARTITLSFWVKSNVTGTFIAELFNAKSGSPKQVSNSYTISAANTWEKKTITIAGDTATGITAANTEQFTLIFWLAAGSNFTSGTLQTAWAAEVAGNRAVGQTNLAATVNNSWQVTGVQIEIGNTATAFQTATGTLQGELAACQRYYYRSTPNLAYGTHPAQGQAQTTTAIAYNVNLPQSMRVTPTAMEFSNLAAFDSATVLALSSITIDVNQSSPKTAWIGGTVSGATQFRSYFLLNNNNSAGYVGFTAEL